MRASSVSDFALHFSCSKVLLIIMYIITITLRCVLLYPCLKIRKLKHRWYVICPRSEILFMVDSVPIHSMGSRSHPGLSSVQFSPSVLSDSLQPHGLKYSRLPCSSLTSRACSNSCPLSWWYHPTISSSVVPFSSRLQSFLALGSFPMSQFFASGGQSVRASALA